MAANDVLPIVDEVHLVDGDDEMRNAEQMRERRVAASSARRRPCRASTSRRELRGATPPVTMLRVYCSWPGASAMMNLRCGVAK